MNNYPNLPDEHDLYFEMHSHSKPNMVQEAVYLQLREFYSQMKSCKSMSLTGNSVPKTTATIGKEPIIKGNYKTREFSLTWHPKSGDPHTEKITGRIIFNDYKLLSVSIHTSHDGLPYATKLKKFLMSK